MISRFWDQNKNTEQFVLSDERSTGARRERAKRHRKPTLTSIYQDVRWLNALSASCRFANRCGVSIVAQPLWQRSASNVESAPRSRRVRTGTQGSHDGYHGLYQPASGGSGLISLP